MERADHDMSHLSLWQIIRRNHERFAQLRKDEALEYDLMKRLITLFNELPDGEWKVAFAQNLFGRRAVDFLAYCKRRLL